MILFEIHFPMKNYFFQAFCGLWVDTFRSPFETAFYMSQITLLGFIGWILVRTLADNESDDEQTIFVKSVTKAFLYVQQNICVQEKLKCFIKLNFCNLSVRNFGFVWEICGGAIKTGIDGKFCKNKVSKGYNIQSVSEQQSSDFEGKFYDRVDKIPFWLSRGKVWLKKNWKDLDFVRSLRSLS